MPQIFPKKANRYPLITLLVVSMGGVVAISLIWYYFSPAFTQVGYAPVQPVEFSHRLHAGELGLDCRYCHAAVEVSEVAMVPSTQTCMSCHAQIQPQSLRLLPVRESWAHDVPVEWIRIHRVPDFAHFSHQVHVNVGVGCETCHGRIDQMEVVAQQAPLSMGWCLDCHRAPEEFLRPAEAVTVMGFEQPEDHVERNLDRIRHQGIRPPENCSACHY